MYCHPKIVVFQIKCNIMWIVLHFTNLKKLCVYLGNLVYNSNFFIYFHPRLTAIISQIKMYIFVFLILLQTNLHWQFLFHKSYAYSYHQWIKVLNNATNSICQTASGILFIGLLLNSSYIRLLVDITPCTYVKDIYNEFIAYNTKNSSVAAYSQS